MDRALWRACRWVGLLATLIACNGSDKLGHAPKVTSVQQLGSVHLSALSVNYWDEYVNALQPQYAITPATALALALQRSSISQSNIADLLSASLQVGLPQSTETLTKSLANTAGNAANTAGTITSGTQTTASGVTTSTGSTTTTSTTQTNNGTTTTQTTTSQQGPGTLPPSQLPSATLPNAAALVAPSGTVQLDPLLTYTAGTAIYQEIQLLNSYVRDAAQRYGYVPYVARVQVSVVPFIRNEPYDVYIDIGLFSRCRLKDDEAPVVVIPLLVTDDVETGQATNAINIARQLAASIGGTISNVALQAGLSDLRSRFKAILGTDYNSLYMVSRAGDNVIQVRLGASRDPNFDPGYAMLTQTHNVSFLMLVDQKYAATGDGCLKPPSKNEKNDGAALRDDPVGIKAGPQIWMTSVTRFRHAITGEELPNSSDVILARAKAIMSRFLGSGELNELDKTKLNPLLYAIQQNNIADFKAQYCDVTNVSAEACAKAVPAGLAESMWTGLTTVVSMSEYAGTYLELPRKPKPSVPVEQIVFLHDNCKDAATATIGGFGSLTPNQFAAKLTLDDKAAGARTVLAATITQATPGGPFTLQLPSLKQFAKPRNAAKEAACPDAPRDGGKIAAPAPPTPITGTLLLSEVADHRWDNGNQDDKSPKPVGYTFTHLYYDGSAASSASVTLSAAADTLTTDATGKGTVRLFVGAKGLDEVNIAFAGASLATPLPANTAAVQPATQPAAELKVATAAGSTSPIVLDVNLQGMVAARVVTIIATGKATAAGQNAAKAVPGATTALALPVIALTPAKPGAASAP